MVFERFGLAQRGQVSQLDTLLRELPAVRPSAAEAIARACYQTEYGIFDHDHAQGFKPLALVALHPKEDVVEGGLLFSHIRRYHSRQIYRNFGISLMEFLTLPPYVVELLYEIAEAESVRTEQVNNTIQRQLDGLRRE